MGLLSVGTPLPWNESLPFVEEVKRRGIVQFINTYNRLKDRANDSFLWGDEVEYILVKINQATRTVRLLLKGPEILSQLDNDPDIDKKSVVFHPEYARYMIETTPGEPYGGFTSHTSLVESNMIKRRQIIHSKLKDDERLMSMASFPLLGAGVHTEPFVPNGGPVTCSTYVPDSIMQTHPRFPCLTANIRERRGGKVCIKVPLFKDVNTQPVDPPPAVNDVGEIQGDSSDFIHLDAMAFGMGCCCLQVTFQCRSIHEARHLYDQLAILSPIMLALTAASPFFKGRIADTDTRWSVISQSVDDRTPFERGILPREVNNVKGKTMPIKKSRYDSIDAFISLDPTMKDSYNDVDLALHEDHLKALIDAGIDNRLARHIAHLFVRDPLVIFKESLGLDDSTETDHFENLQSTNWNTVRFKPPPPRTTTGWRVEFRSMEVQLTDFENAAFTVFTALLSRAILFLNLNWYIPISQCDENLKRAHRRDAVNTQKFFMRRHSNLKCGKDIHGDPDASDELTMTEIMRGKDRYFPGLVPTVVAYLDAIKCDSTSRALIDQYIDFIEMRATGELTTAATFMRRFVSRHADYRHDSILSASTVHDLIICCDALSQGTLQCPQLLPELGSDHQKILNSSIKAASEPTESGVPLSIDLDDTDVSVRESICKIIKKAFTSRQSKVADADEPTGSSAKLACC